ncbi:TlpA family protein disulfide reductase [Nocardiopsis gilva YIM 90087]|uniref:TlpA family protein disulfide reductase n=1 Tax=Nocardiopsis gilva YIM 90087 TaxID=1235441 RepID=A0A223S122_9ACTN|nr:TlpA disulfide reductase family protein [Nocardiopsis gilva]ASU81843.1 TlpA family protein disulfide reductase [Nocardiopsis gilva YIM 90087]
MGGFRRALIAVAVVAVVMGVGVVLLLGDGDRPPAPSSSSTPTGVTRFAPEERPDAEPLAGPLLEGGRMDLDSLRGDVVVVNVWGSWCPPCREEAPDLQRTWEETRDEGVQFLGVNTRDTESGARSFVEEFGITYPSIIDPDGERLRAWRELIPVQAIPSTVVIDRDGRVAARVIGPVTDDTLRDLVDAAARERKPDQ